MKKSIFVAPIAAALTIFATPAAASDDLVAFAGEDGVVDTARQCNVHIVGTASTRSPATLKFRWRNGKSVVSQWREVRADRTAPLELCGLPVGSHALTLEVADGQRVVTSSLTATIVATSALVATSAER
jgi:hypothetical protein